MPENGVKLLDKKQILSYEQVIEAVKILTDSGIEKIRITGGEPFARKDISKLIIGLKELDGIKDLAITTNGVLLGKFIKVLKEAGIKRLNISIDSLDAEKYRKITRGGDLKIVLNNLKSAIDAGFEEIKINTVITESLTIEDIKKLINLSKELPVHVRFIEMMDLPQDRDGENYSQSVKLLRAVECRNSSSPQKFPASFINSMLSPLDIISMLKDFGNFKETAEHPGYGPSFYYKIEGSPGSVGFIINNKNYCSYCNRIRLTPFGTLRLCLFSDMEFDIAGMLRNKVEPAKIKKRLIDFVKTKPKDRQESCALRYPDETLPKETSGKGSSYKAGKKAGNVKELLLAEYMNKIGG